MQSIFSFPPYRIIVKGASGGLGTGNPSLATTNGGGGGNGHGLTGYGARIRAVFPLTAGTLIYFLVGQEGAAGGTVQRDVRVSYNLEFPAVFDY